MTGLKGALLRHARAVFEIALFGVCLSCEAGNQTLRQSTKAGKGGFKGVRHIHEEEGCW